MVASSSQTTSTKLSAFGGIVSKTLVVGGGSDGRTRVVDEVIRVAGAPVLVVVTVSEGLGQWVGYCWHRERSLPSGVKRLQNSTVYLLGDRMPCRPALEVLILDPDPDPDPDSDFPNLSPSLPSLLLIALPSAHTFTAAISPPLTSIRPSHSLRA